MSDKGARLEVGDGSYDYDIVPATVGSDGIDISALRAETGKVLFDPGFANTAGTRSKLTYVDGAAGLLRHRGYRIEDLAEHCSFLEVSYLLLFGDLPTRDELDDWTDTVRNHTMLSEEMKRFFDAFPRSAHPMAILSSATNAISTFYERYYNPSDPDAIRRERQSADCQDADHRSMGLQEVGWPALRVPK